MDSVVRGLIVYFFLLVIFRLSGNRTLGQTTSFDLVLLLIISETTQQAMVNGDHSMMNCFLLIITLVGTSIALSYLKEWLPSFEKWIAADRPACRAWGEIKYAIVERSGMITVVPKREEGK